MTSTPESTRSTDSSEPTGASEPELTPEPADAAEPTELTPESALVTETDAQTDIPSDAAAEPPVRAQPVPATPTPEELELAAAALHDVTPRGSVGHVLDALLEGGEGDQAQVLAIRHASSLPGYPDWTWTVLLSRGIEGGPTVLEVALLPGEGSLLSPAWVPWSERLADYLAAKEAAGTEGEDDELESDLESDLEDDFDDDFDDEDEESDGWGEVAESDAEPDASRA
ncbi:MAG: DUF3027 domain-containing protein [Actinomycetota bacterium]